MAFPAAALALPAEGRSDAQRWLVVAALVCALLNHLVTIAGNVPLNNALAAAETPLNSPGGEGSSDSAARAAFEARWNRFHRARTLLAVAAFALVVSAVPA
ncbi:anthrone oxygenase family protein [Streptomyces sp. NPDC088725]|uniref:anthrone oxygenase family protein n=1 Tax=Streptomyces sp. NPDC088725 TaxID=3365873 RepID=UPI0038021D0B